MTSDAQSAANAATNDSGARKRRSSDLAEVLSALIRANAARNPAGFLLYLELFGD